MNGRFAVLSFNQFIQFKGYVLEFTTDTPCHLWLYYTHRKPPVHLETILRRGLAMHCNPRFCFSKLRDLEQHEIGDTLVHSFNYFPDKLPANIWFYLGGKIAGSDSPSTSPIMHLPVNMKQAQINAQEGDHPLMARAFSYNKPLAMNFQESGSFPVDAIEFSTYGTTQPASIIASIYQCNNISGRPETHLVSTEIPFLPSKLCPLPRNWFLIPIKRILVGWPNVYAIVLFGDPDIPDTHVAAWGIRWWTGPHTNLFAWEGTRVGAGYNWTRKDLRQHGWKLISGIPFYQPGPPTAKQLWD